MQADGVVRRRGDTMDKHRVRLQIRPLFQTRLDKGSPECHDQPLGRDDEVHDGRNESKQENGAFGGRYYPLLCPSSRCPNLNPLCDKNEILLHHNRIGGAKEIIYSCSKLIW